MNKPTLAAALLAIALPPISALAQEATSVTVRPLIQFTSPAVQDSGYPGHGGLAAPTLGTDGRLYGLANEVEKAPNEIALAWELNLDTLAYSVVDYSARARCNPPKFQLETSNAPLILLDSGELLGGAYGTVPVVNTAFPESLWDVLFPPCLARGEKSLAHSFLLSPSGDGGNFSMEVFPATAENLSDADIAFGLAEHALANSELTFAAIRSEGARDAEGNIYFFATTKSEEIASAFVIPARLLIQRSVSDGQYRVLADLQQHPIAQVPNSVTGVVGRAPSGLFFIYNPEDEYFYGGAAPDSSGEAFGGVLFRVAKTEVDRILAISTPLGNDDLSAMEAERLHDFNAQSAPNPQGALYGRRQDVMSSALLDGHYLYGTSYATAAAGGATAHLWRYDTARAGESDAFILTHSFAVSGNISGGNMPAGLLAKGLDDRIYGTTRQGGNNNNGTLWRLTTTEEDGVRTDSVETLYHFTAEDPDAVGTRPTGLIAAGFIEGEGDVMSGRLLGTTGVGVNGFGAVYEVLYDLPPVEIRSFTATPASLAVGDGQSIVLSWDVANTTAADQCVISADGSSQYVDVSAVRRAASGSLTLATPQQSGEVEFLLSCDAHEAGETVTQTALVEVSAPPVEIASFTVSPATVTAGSTTPITLTWSVLNSLDATPCVISSTEYASLATEPRAASGSLTLTPPAQSGAVSFQLSCDGHEGAETVSGTASLAVTAASGGGGGGALGAGLLALLAAGLLRRRTLQS